MMNPLQNTTQHHSEGSTTMQNRTPLYNEKATYSVNRGETVSEYYVTNEDDRTFGRNLDLECDLQIVTPHSAATLDFGHYLWENESTESKQESLQALLDDIRAITRLVAEAKAVRESLMSALRVAQEMGYGTFGDGVDD